MTPLIDINVVLDVFLVRQPWFDDAALIWDAHRNGEISGAVAAFTLPTLFYIMRRQTDADRAREAVRICLTALDIAAVGRPELELARNLPGSDFEDNLQIACAVNAGRDSIVTRNPKDFSAAPLPVFTPAEFLTRLAQQKP